MKRKYTISQRLREVMILKELQQIDILKKAQPICKIQNIKLGSNDLSQYVTGKVEPSQKKLGILAEALNVNEVWLLGYDVDMNDTPLQLTDNTFSSRLKQAMDYKGIKNKDLVKKTKIDRSHITNYKKGKYKPKQDNLQKLANALGVSEAWLMGYDSNVNSNDISIGKRIDDNEIVIKIEIHINK